jgi:hypothetical protein
MNLKEAKTMGVRLINALSEQIEATLDIKTNLEPHLN